MATNPMQRKARLSFMLGMIVTLLICGVIIALLFIQLTNYQKKEKENQAASVQVYTLNVDVSSGQVITTDMYTMQTVNKNLVPSNATSDLSTISNYSLQDKEGNEVVTKYDKTDSTGKRTGTLYLVKDGNEVELKQDEETQNYYIEKGSNKEFVELNNVPLIAKVEMKANTVITTELLAKGENSLADDVRREEYNSFLLPMDLATGDYVDVRLMLPSGQNYIVVAKKEVEVPNISGVDSLETIWMNMSEDEILTVSSAIVDAYRITGSKLYVTKYTEAGMQKAATPTYVVTPETAALMNKDPNILEKAITGLKERYRNLDSSNIRSEYIQKAINEQEEETVKQNLESKMEESIEKTQETRQKYLDSLSGAVQ
ncbi:MAG: hypothetical protein IKF38_07230 [Clostridia bacterium]|nr:hypothetical protein [Clostridia bacterium]